MYIQNGAVVNVESNRLSLFGEYGVNIADSNVTVAAKDNEMNAVYVPNGTLEISRSTVEAETISSSSYPALWGNEIKISDNSDVKATSNGDCGIYANAKLAIDNSKVTSTGCISPYITNGIVGKGEIEISGGADVTAIGGISSNSSIMVSPAVGELVDVIVGNDTSGEDAGHFSEENLQSPYDKTTIFDGDALTNLDGYTYAHIRIHVHAYDQEIVSDGYKAADATCENPAAYYYSCVCGEKGTETFTYGQAAGHKESTKWEYDAANHWKVCTVCGTKLTEDAHTFVWITDKKATDKEAGLKHEECNVCGYAKKAVEIAPSGTQNQTPGTDKPTSGTDTQKAGNQTTAAVKTGDNQYAVLWFALMCMAGISVVGSCIYSNKKLKK